MEAEAKADEVAIILGFDTSGGIRRCHITPRPWGLFVELFNNNASSPSMSRAFSNLYDIYDFLVDESNGGLVYLIKPERCELPLKRWLRSNEALRLVGQPDMPVVDKSVDIEVVTTTKPPYINFSLWDFVLVILTVFLGGALAGVASVWIRMSSN